MRSAGEQGRVGKEGRGRTRKWERSREEDPRRMRSWARVRQREMSAFKGATTGGKWSK